MIADDKAQTLEDELRAANEIVYTHSLELARLKEALEIANSQQENLLHFISHEIKGYLTEGQNALPVSSKGITVRYRCRSNRWRKQRSRACVTASRRL